MASLQDIFQSITDMENLRWVDPQSEGGYGDMMFFLSFENFKMKSSTQEVLNPGSLLENGHLNTLY